jgi:hypothetical protein
MAAGFTLYVASLLGRIVGGWAANRQLFWLFFPGLVRRSRLDEYTDDGVENGVAYCQTIASRKHLPV